MTAMVRIKPIVYFLQRADGQIKIGTTTGYAVRLYELEREYGKLVLLGWMHGNRIQERQLHDQFDHLRRDGEWFAPSPVLIEYIGQVKQEGDPPKITRSKRQAELLWLKEISQVEAVISELQTTIQQQARTIMEQQQTILKLQADHYYDAEVIKSLERDAAHAMDLVRQTAFELGQVERQYQSGR